MTKQNRIAWLDSLRVIASLMVVVSHFSYVAAQSPEVSDFLQKYVFYTGFVGVVFFFAVSGYLAANSLQHSDSVLEFYRRKIIRILVPYVSAYIVLGLILTFLAKIFPILEEKSPVYFLLNKNDWLAVVLGIFPIEINFLKFFNLPSYTVVGEWFIGAIIFLYLLAPAFSFFLKKNALLTFVVTVIFSTFIYDAAENLVKAGKFFDASMFFPVRIPEFLMGMILYDCREFLSKHENKLLPVAFFLFIVFVGFGLIFNEKFTNIWWKIIFFPPSIPVFDFKVVISVYVVYIFLRYVNGHFEKFLVHFNGCSNISYMAMLIHHTIIFSLDSVFKFSTFNTLTLIFFLILTIVITIFLSKFIHMVYKPVEEKLIRLKFQ